MVMARVMLLTSLTIYLALQPLSHARSEAADEELWWSLRPLPAAEAAGADSAPRTIDSYVRAALERAGLAPSPPADRRTLLRRVTYDLTGLPPSTEELAAFLEDEAEDAYERVVERLLASRRYGERWARHWLDVVHYGDTHGYDKDKRRPNAWPYRDWVVNALNADIPYDEFVELQLAGDVLHPDDAQAITATGFVVAGPWDFVGHVELREGTLDKDIVRNLDRDDMVASTMSSFASVTAHCARCHDHKFDPIPQSDYYSLQAVFAGVERADRDVDHDLAVGSRRSELESAISKARTAREQLQVRVEQLQPAEAAAIEQRALELEGTLARRGLPASERPRPTNGYHSQIEQAPDVTKWVQVDLGAEHLVERIVLVGAHVEFGGHAGPGFGFVPRFRVELSCDEEFAGPVTLVADHTGADFPHPGSAPISLLPAAPTRARFVRVTATRLWERTDDFVFALAELAAFERGVNIAQGAHVTALDTIEAGEDWGRRLLVDGCFARTSVQELEQLRLPEDRDVFETLARRAGLEREALELRARIPALRLAAAGPEIREQLDTLAIQLELLERAQSQLPAPDRVYAVTPTPSGEPREIHVLRRGAVRDRLEAVDPGALSAVAALPASFSPPRGGTLSEGERRLALARWLTDESNPLTWRSIANRVWHLHFGRGLVATTNDFGRMGDQPSHPELLDWLAARFRDGDRSLKSLHREIVLSATYRQSAGHRADAARVDAGNRLLWRMNRRRLGSEELRDTILAISGCLDETPGGPGFDNFVYEDDHSPRYLYAEYDVEDPRTWRRSIYRTLVRSVPDPWMESFDCADPSTSVPARIETTTPLQSLALLNNRFVLSQARHLARRVQGAGSVTQQVQAAFRRALAREPEQAELAALVAHARAHGLPATCRVLFNLSELVYVD